jgi:hypothetical protein
MARHHRLDRHGQGGDGHRHDLGPGQPFAQQREADDNAEQRVDVVPEAGFEGATGGHRPNEDAPAHRHQKRGEQQARHEPPVRQVGQQVLQLAKRPQRAKRNGDRPEGAVRHHLEHVDVGQGAEKQPIEAPQPIGEERKHDPFLGLGALIHGAP